MFGSLQVVEMKKKSRKKNQKVSFQIKIEENTYFLFLIANFHKKKIYKEVKWIWIYVELGTVTGMILNRRWRYG